MAASFFKFVIFICAINSISSFSESLNSENYLNALVPKNDINLQEKIKKIHNGKMDDEDWMTENNLVDLVEVLPKEKFIKIVQNYKNENNKVNDSQNKNNLANKIDIADLLNSNTNKTKREGHSETTTPFIKIVETTTQSIVNSSSTDKNDIKNVDYEDDEIESSEKLKFKIENLSKKECVLRTANHYLKWVSINGSLKIDDLSFSDKFYEDYSYKFKNQMQCERYIRELNNIGNTNQEKFQNLKMLSLAFNNLESLPNELLQLSNATLEYLSLTGNNFNFKKEEYLIDRGDENDNYHVVYYRIYKSFPRIENLKQLDLRNCKMTEIRDDFLMDLENLRFLYLSENNIINISPKAFNNLNKLLHLDLSHNKILVVEKQVGLKLIPEPVAEVLEGLKLKERQFERLFNLKLLDLSFTKIEPKSFKALEYVQPRLTHLSLCYTDMPAITEGFFRNMLGLVVLDLSGNVKLSGNLHEETFTSVGDTLEVLYIRTSNIKTMNWTRPLRNLRALNLNENRITALKNESFISMPRLEIFDLGYNFIGNWYYRILVHDNRLKMINLRNNKINMLTKDMKKDLSNIEVIGLGKNDFECSCILHTFFNKVFDNTKSTNKSENFEESSEELSSEENQNSKMGNEYNVLRRIYQKYKDLMSKSSEALIKNNFTKTNEVSGKSANSKKYDSIQHRFFNEELVADKILTKLFDYSDEDYQCINVTIKTKISIMKILNKCTDVDSKVDEDLENYLQDIGEQNTPLIATISSVITFLIIGVLVTVIYWKWWYIKYFCILFKNSTILSFLSDDQDLLNKNNGDSYCEGGFIYDVFVSYCDDNREWVLNELIVEIEKREAINVCLHERDFQVGYSILENIISCMDRSRVLLLVISESFLLSQWCQFEMHLAQHRLIETRRDKLILVLLEDINHRKQSKTLKYLMKTKTYIKWPADEKDLEQKKLFWKRLKKAITTSNWENVNETNYGSVKLDPIKQ